MNDKIDPVMKLAQHQPPCAALPKEWYARRLNQDEIVVSGPCGVLTLNGKDFRASFAARLLYCLIDAMLNEQRKSS